MVYEEFLSTVKNELSTRLGDDYTIAVQKIQKNNGITLDGLCITKKDEQSTPTIYLNAFFKYLSSGAPMTSVLDEIISVYTEGTSFPHVDPDILNHFDLLKDRVVYKLIHTKSNEARLTDLPHIPYLDLSIIFYLFLEENTYGHMTATIHNSHLEAWGVTTEGLLALAAENTPRYLPAEMRSMDEVIDKIIAEQPMDGFTKELLQGQSPSRHQSPLYVLTNQFGVNGSCAILYEGLIKNFADSLGKDVIILPSSIHEVLLTPYSDDIDLEDLAHMVRYINLTEVPVEDRLSNELYLYHRSAGQVTMISRLSENQTS